MHAVAVAGHQKRDQMTFANQRLKKLFRLCGLLSCQLFPIIFENFIEM
jgi:hypothetical protein